MKCPHCNKYLDNPVTALRRKRRKDGKCLDCGEVLVGDDTNFVRCDFCRDRAMKRARARRGSRLADTAA